MPILDARPDRIDFRDRSYNPPLKSLPVQWPPQEYIDQIIELYTDAKLILDQGSEGACTGFGLAAVINYLIWYDTLSFIQNKKGQVTTIINKDENGNILEIKKNGKNANYFPDKLVSPWMLYQLARIYDEWDGEDYEGSSCRGAMKGWHRHGACTKKKWPQLSSNKNQPDPLWVNESLLNPLGTYYRVEQDSIADMQAAIKEVGALYCSAKVHKGWSSLKQIKKFSKSIIPFNDHQTGGHAFALVGYTPLGFIVQNSWGQNWGHNGFAILTYADWIANGNDAWVAVRGAPQVGTQTKKPQLIASRMIQSIPTSKQLGQSRFLAHQKGGQALLPQIQQWSDEETLRHSLVINHDGRPKLTVVDRDDVESSAKEVCFSSPEAWLNDNDNSSKHIVIYAHGGLNSETVSNKRIAAMGPYFKANGIYPIFITWKTGLLETFANLISDKIPSIQEWLKSERDKSFGSDILEKLSEKSDAAIEFASRKAGGKAIWDDIKQTAINANDFSVPGHPQKKEGAMILLARFLTELQKKHKCKIHIIGHSAGQIILGYWLEQLAKKSTSLKVKIETATFLAPAGSVSFSHRVFEKAGAKNILDLKKLHIDLLSDEAERSDNVINIYRKSLLYLVSRGAEEIKDLPLLGMDASWGTPLHPSQQTFNPHSAKTLKEWQKFEQKQGISKAVYPIQHRPVTKKVNNVPLSTIDLAHGSFDNDIEVMTNAMLRILGTNQLITNIEDLSSF